MLPISQAERHLLLQAHGNFALAYSVAFQPGLERFGGPDGFLAYRMAGRTAYVLADPLAPQENHGALIDAFVREKRDVTFWQVSHATAELLDARGFLVNELGLENFIELASYGFEGPERRSFRTAVNRFERSGHSVAEPPLTAFDRLRLETISEGWRHTRTTKRRELQFLVRPIVLADEPGVRKFFILDRSGEPVAFAFFDPIYENGRVVSYLSTTRRWLPGADPLSAYLLVRRAIETFHAEGVERMHFGLMPFHRIEDKEFTKDWLTRRAFRFIYSNPVANRLVYPAPTVARHKESHGGTSRQTYCAMNTRPSLPRLIKLARVCRII